MADKKEETKLVGQSSKGYNYNYTSLADLVRAGVALPKMRVATLVDGNGVPVIVEGQPVEYIEALIENKDGEGHLISTEWVRGARIVVPKGKQTNATQDYGAALTYARRYTALTVLGIACDSDDKIEKGSKVEKNANVFNEAERYAELSALWEQAGGHEGFDDWFEKSTPNGFDQKTYAALKTKLMDKIKTKEQKNG